MKDDSMQPPVAFPTTQWTVIEQAGQEDKSVALEKILNLYHPALQSHLIYQLGLSAHEAEDILHDFIADKILEKKLLKNADRKKGKFRSYVLKVLDNYVIQQKRRSLADKREPERARQFDPEVNPDQHLPSPNASVDVFDVIWAKKTVEGRVKLITAAVLTIFCLSAVFVFIHRGRGTPGSNTVYFQDFNDASGFLADYFPNDGARFYWDDMSRTYNVTIFGEHARSNWVLSEPFPPVADSCFKLETYLLLTASGDAAPPVDIRLFNLPDELSNPLDEIESVPGLIVRFYPTTGEVSITDSYQSYMFSDIPLDTMLRLGLAYDDNSGLATVSVQTPISDEDSLWVENISLSPPSFSVVALGTPSFIDFPGQATLAMDSILIKKF